MSMETSGSAYYGLHFPIEESRHDGDFADKLEKIKVMVESVGLEVDYTFDTYHDEIRDLVVGIKLDELNQKQIIDAMNKVFNSFSQAITQNIEELIECEASSDVFGVHVTIVLDE